MSEGKWDAREWEDFQPTHNLPPDISGKLWRNINKNANPATHYPYWSWMAVAASVLVVAGLSWFFMRKRQGISTNNTPTLAIKKNIFNNTPKKMTLTLGDGSIVELSPDSKLSYAENFSPSKREVILSGEANFNIAKDIARPFSVSGNSVLITVLGTRFTVNAFDANNATKVILHEGSVMIKVPNSSSPGNKSEYYLAPGDIFIFRKVNRQPRIDAGPIATSKDISTDTLPSTDSLSARILHLEKDKEDGYAFDNYPLDVVFDQLQIIYNTKIIYDKAQLGNRSFIGKIDKKDSLYHILKGIALLNNFRLHQQGDSFIVGN
jgi:transmembrane sensor